MVALPSTKTVELLHKIRQQSSSLNKPSCDQGSRARRDSINVPLRQAEEVILLGTLREAGNAEPADLAIVAGSGVAGDSVANKLTASAGWDDLGGVSEVADDGDAGDRARGGGAESPGTESGAAHEERGRHCQGGWEVLVGG